MIRFDVERADPLAVRIALAACRSPLRIERSGRRVSIVAADDDARDARQLWSRAGVEPRPASPWPGARLLPRGALEVDGVGRCLARVPVDAAPRDGECYLALVPVARADAVRVLVRALDTPIRIPFRRRPRRVAKIAAAILHRQDGVVAVRAYELAPDAERPFRSARAARLRRGALAAWRDLGAPSGGVWRSLAALQAWWEPHER